LTVCHLQHFDLSPFFLPSSFLLGYIVSFFPPVGLLCYSIASAPFPPAAPVSPSSAGA